MVDTPRGRVRDKQRPSICKHHFLFLRAMASNLLGGSIKPYFERYSKILFGWKTTWSGHVRGVL